MQQRHRFAALQDRRHLARTQSRVDAGGDRAEPHARGVGDRVVDARRERERDDVTRHDAAFAQFGGQGVGALEPSRIREPLVAVDVRERVRFA